MTEVTTGSHKKDRQIVELIKKNGRPLLIANLYNEARFILARRFNDELVVFTELADGNDALDNRPKWKSAQGITRAFAQHFFDEWARDFCVDESDEGIDT